MYSRSSSCPVSSALRRTPENAKSRSMLTSGFTGPLPARRLSFRPTALDRDRSEGSCVRRVRQTSLVGRPFLFTSPAPLSPFPPQRGRFRTGGRLRWGYASSDGHLSSCPRTITVTDAGVVRSGEPVGLNPNIRIYRYSKHQYFDAHCTLATWPALVPFCPPRRGKQRSIRACVHRTDDPAMKMTIPTWSSCRWNLRAL